MSARYLLDTSVLSAAMRPTPPAGLLDRLDTEAGQLALPALVWHELRFGILRLPTSRRRDALEAFLNDVVLPTMPILPYDRPASEWHAAQRARLVNAGRPTPFVDGQIAAIAATQGLVLVTDNVKDFQPFDGITIENWVRQHQP